jgi:hypothetical protein
VRDAGRRAGVLAGRGAAVTARAVSSPTKNEEDDEQDDDNETDAAKNLDPRRHAWGAVIVVLAAVAMGRRISHGVLLCR